MFAILPFTPKERNSPRNDMDRQTDKAADFVIRPGAVIAESGRIFWHLRAILGGLVGIFVLLSVAMFGVLKNQLQHWVNEQRWLDYLIVPCG
jgi:hypothetical protein